MRNRSALWAALIWPGLGAAGAAAQDPAPDITLVLPGGEYEARDLPPDAGGAWWVLRGPMEATVLSSREVEVSAVPSCSDEPSDPPSGRTISVPGVPDPILLMRGSINLAAGPIRSAFLDDGVSGEAEQIEVPWDGTTVTVRHLTEEPSGDQPGRYRIELQVGDRDAVLLEDQWQGDGQWRLRWMGDLNRDGWPDLLVDASYKYSVYTSRLILSGRSAGQVTFREVATFTRSAC